MEPLFSKAEFSKRDPPKIKSFVLMQNGIYNPKKNKVNMMKRG